MLRMIFLLLLTLLTVPHVQAAQSTITEVEGYACMGEDKSRKETEQAAMADVKRKASESILTYVKSETRVKDFALEKDIVSAYANSKVRIIEELEKKWYRDAAAGDCFKMRVKAEVLPDEKAIEKASKKENQSLDPSAPLNIRTWTDKKHYGQGEKIKVYIQGNKPFYARVLYRDASGAMIQILPNPYREANYFEGGVVYEIPSGKDRFELEVSPPFGEESIIVFSSTSQLGEINLQPAGGVYKINTQSKDIAVKTRGVKIQQKMSGREKEISEFFEDRLILTTGK
ncbi:MAG: DUF4384 domain-containing protein [Syntrophales bacterium]